MTATPRPGDPHITPALVAEHGLTADEFERLRAMLGREPTFTELGIISALWSMDFGSGAMARRRRA